MSWLDRFETMSHEDIVQTIAEDPSTFAEVLREAIRHRDWYLRWVAAREPIPTPTEHQPWCHFGRDAECECHLPPPTAALPAEPPPDLVSAETEPKAADVDLHATMDAWVWAQEWVRIAREIEAANDGRQVIDEGWMIAWFANAIMVGYDIGRARLEAEHRAALAALPAEPPATPCRSCGGTSYRTLALCNACDRPAHGGPDGR